MPQVTLLFSGGRTVRDSGGCFGFSGRNGSMFARPRDGEEIETYRYHFGEQWGSKPREGLLDPTPLLKWMAEESCWSYYIKDYNLDLDNFSRSHFDIRTDVEGHAVIGTASAIRLVSHKAATLVPFVNMCAQIGGNIGIALLVYYSLWGKTTNGLTVVEGKAKIGRGNSTTLGTGYKDTQNLSDDEVMLLNKINPYSLYGILSNTFRYSEEGEPLYSTGAGYEEHILSSFKSRKGKSFGKYLLDRFTQPLAVPDVIQASSGMGKSTNFTLSHQTSMNPTFLIGIVGQLTSEFEANGEFRGFF